MSRLPAIIAIVIAVGAAVYVAWTWAFPTGTIRYRLTVGVEVDGKVYSGSSVSQVEYLPGGQRIGLREQAEAVVVDLGTRGPVFMLLDGAPPAVAGGYRARPSTIPVKEFGIAPAIGSLTTDDMRRMWNIEASAEIPLERLQLLARFDNTLDPATGRRVDPNNFAEAFGPGVRLTKVTVETTHDPLTTKIVERLPWLTDYEQATIAWRAIIKGIEGWGSYGPPDLFVRR